MSNHEQLRARTLALFHSLVSNWANEIRKDMTQIQDGLVLQLDSLQEKLSRYEETMEESAIVAFAEDLSKMTSASGATGGAGSGAAMLSQVRRAMELLDRGTSLTEVLTELVQEAAQVAPRAAMFILKSGNCVGWYAQGFDQSPGFNNEAVKKISVPATADTVFRAVINSRQSFVGESTAHKDNVQLLSRIGNVLPSTIFATPLVLRDKIAAVFYADNGDARGQLEGSEALEILVSYAAKVIDLLSTSKSGAKTSETPSERPREVPFAQAPASNIPGLEESGGSTVMFRPPAATPVNQGAPSRTPVASPAPASRPAPAPAPAPQAGRTTAPMDIETRKQHEDAKRFAKLLVSEIKLYRESEVQQGRKHHDLYARLKDDIDRSRQLYLERVPTAVRGNSNYFNEELVRILADGDSSALGQALSH